MKNIIIITAFAFSIIACNKKAETKEKTKDKTVTEKINVAPSELRYQSIKINV